MKILFLSSWYPNRIHPHLGNFVQRHAEAVSAYNEVASLSVCADPYLLGKKVDVQTKKINGVFTVNVYYQPVKSIFFIRQLRKYFRSQKAYHAGYHEIVNYFNSHPDAVHLNVAFPAGLFAMRLKRKFGINYILTEHSTKYHLSMKWLESFFTKRICNKATLICPVSDHLKKVMEKNGFGKKFDVVPNVVNTSVFTVGEKKERQKKKIIHISTLIEWQKNVSGMLHVIKELSEKRNDFELDIICEKNSPDAVTITKRFGLFDTIVHFYPDQQPEKVAEMLRESDILLLFSNFENLPCVIIESLASGVPVVSTNVGGIPELINEKNGMLVHAKDEDSLYETLNTMLDKHLAFDKKEMRKNAIERFSYEVVGKKFTDIYRQILFKKLNKVN